MKRWFLLLLLPLLLAALAAMAGYFYLSTQDFELVRVEIEEALEESLGREVRIAGAFEVGVLPVPTVGMREVSVANAAWGTRAQMLDVSLLEMRLALLPLLVREIQIRRLVLHDASLWLENNENGDHNWGFESRHDEQPGDAELKVSEVELRNLNVGFFNTDTGVTRTLQLDYFDIQAPAPDELLDVRVEGYLRDGRELRVDGRLSSIAALLSRTGFELDMHVELGDSIADVKGAFHDQDFTDFSGTELSIQGHGLAFNELKQWLDFDLPEARRHSYRAELRGGPDTLRLTELEGRVEGEGFSVSVEGSIGALVRLEDIDLRLQSEGRSINDLIPAWDWPWTRTDEYEFRARLIGSAQVPRLEDLYLRATVPRAELVFEGRIGDARDLDDIALTSSFQAQHIGGLKDVFRLPIPDVDSVDITMNIVGHASATRITRLEATLAEDSSTAKVSGSIDDLDTLSGMDMHFTVEGSDLDDLSDLLPVTLPNASPYSASGRLEGNRHDLDLFIDRGEVRRASMALTFSGRVDDLLEVPKYDLPARLTGTSLVELGALYDWPLPETDAFWANGRFSGAGEVFDLESLDATVRARGIEANFTGRLPDFLNSLRIDLSGEVEGGNLANLGGLLGIESQLPGSDSFSVSATAGGTWLAPVLTDVKGKLAKPGLSLQVSGQIGDILDLEDFDLEIQGQVESLGTLLALDGDAWRRLGKIQTRFHVSGGPRYFHFDFDDFDSTGSRLQGAVDLQLTGGRVTEIRGAFEDSLLDIRPWLPVEETETADDKPRGPVFSEQSFDLGWLDLITVDFDLSGLTLVVATEPVEVEEGRLRLRNGVLDLDPFNATYRDATITGGLRLSSGATYTLDTFIETLNFDLGRLTRSAGIDDEAKGVIDVEARIEAEGRSPREMAASFNGRVAGLMTDGYLGQGRTGLTWLQVLSGLLPWTEQREDMIIECLAIDLPISYGKGHLNVFVLDTDAMLMRGEGDIDFGTEKIKVLFRPRPKRGRTFSHNVNVKVSGTLGNPKFGVQTRDTTRKVAASIGKFTLLGPGGLFLSTDTFRSTRHECAESLEQMREIE